MTAIILTAATVLPLLAGCAGSATPTPITFEGLCGLTHEQFETMDEEEVLRWVEHEYGVSASRDQRGTVVSFVWVEGETTRRADLHNGQLILVSVESWANGPTFGQVVDGLGSPAFVYRYVVRYENTLYAITLDYPQQGVSVGTQGLDKGYKESVALARGMRVMHVYCYQPGSMQDVLNRSFLLPPPSLQFQMESRIKWPGFGVSIPLAREP
jgi:hypothetical protein